jgi:predicted O-linked N-acetylglucosamine transferase (SPINDLY family)
MTFLQTPEIFEKAKALFLAGTSALDAGDLSRAEAQLLECLNLVPDRESTKQNLAIVFTLKADGLSDRGEKNDALAAYDRALVYNPNLALALSNKGILLNDAFQLVDAAVACFEKALQISPNFADAYLNLGACYATGGQHSKAIEYFDRGISIDPNLSEAWLNRGNTLNALKRHEEALISYETATRINPAEAQAWIHRADVLGQLQRFEESVESYGRALELKPELAEVWANRANVLIDLKRYKDALASCDRALELKPNLAEAWVNQANVLVDLDRHMEALIGYGQAIKIDPEDPEVWSNQGNVLNHLKRHEEAIASFERALKLKPGIDHALGDLVHTQMNICDWSDLEQRCMRLEQRLRAGDKASAPFPVLGLFDNPQLQKLSAQLYVKNKLSAVSPLGPIPPRKPGGKIRLGYYSADFHNHATAYLMAELFESHDRNRFELYAFSFGPDSQDEMRQRVSKAFDHFIDVRAQSDRAVAFLSRELGIDIAIDLKGYTKGSRTMIFAHRAASVQINYLGYPGTMGTDYMDYLIADPTLIPPQSQEFYTEKIIYLPHTYQVNDAKRVIADKRWSRPDLGLPAEGFVFCCFNNNYKITPETFGIWMRLLQAVGGSVLWLLEDNATAVKNLQKRAHAAGVEPDRLVFAKRMPLPEHLARHRLADLFLDTLPYNAHTTASDALWMGLPVLTRCGQSFPSRVASSLLHAVGLPELITHSAEAYESLAIELALNPQRLTDLKTKLDANRLTSPLFNTPMFTKHIESAYQVAHQRHLAELEPEHVHVQH